MKTKYLFLGLALVCLLGACSRDEESLFDKSAAERAQAALDNANDVLTSPECGWEMLYFANVESAGYNIVVHFEPNGQVIATAKNATTTNNKMLTDSVSTWAVKNDNGPILTFDTYNDVLHAWADPRSDGDGLLGDYEFLILDADANFVKLKGKKHGGYNYGPNMACYCYLYPMQKDLSLEDYFAQIETMQSKLFANGNILHLHIEEHEYLLFGGSTGMFLIAELGQLPVYEDADFYPFATRMNGIQMTHPLLDLKDVQYELRDGKLVGEGSTLDALAPAAYIPEYLEMVSGKWGVDLEETSDTIKNVIESIDAALKAAYTKNKKNAKVNSLKFKLYGAQIVLTFSYYGNSGKATTDVNYVFDIAQEGDRIKVTYSEPADDNAQKVLNAFPTIEVLLNTLSGTFLPETQEVINPSFGIQLKNQTESDIWYNIIGSL